MKDIKYPEQLLDLSEDELGAHEKGYWTKKSSSQNMTFIARFEVSIAVKIRIEVFWIEMPCSVAVGYQRFRGTRCLHLRSEVCVHLLEDGGNMDL